MTSCVACLRRLKKAETDFCAACRQELFDGAAVSVLLPFAPPATATYEETQRLHELTRQISVSGVQEKFSLRLADEGASQLSLTARGGQYILKPVPPTRFQNVAELPANEHFTMQLARQVFKLPTAACAVMRFVDGSPAYLTRRFDVLPDGARLFLPFCLFAFLVLAHFGESTAFLDSGCRHCADIAFLFISFDCVAKLQRCIW